MSISVPDAVSPELLSTLRAAGMSVSVDSDQSWLDQLSGAGDALTNARIRLIGAPASVVTATTDGRPDVAVYDGDVVLAGRVELLPFVREQAVSITAHRFGTPNHLSDTLI
jgi:RHH-type proline utilization regulon transcriptional repressor/proline dehydrogenase/delta 1-pyrroline-5-carboxylate dehydrogenase